MLWETVHTVTDWYDGERLGIAIYQGRPHLFESRWDPSKDDWEGEQGDSYYYWLSPIESEAFELALEDWDIWKRWRIAFVQDKVELHTHPALPEEKARHEEIVAQLGNELKPRRPAAFMVTGRFSADGVNWGCRFRIRRLARFFPEAQDQLLEPIVLGKLFR